MPTPTPEHHRLIAAMAGDWTAEERMFPSPWDPGGERVGRCHARAALGDLFLITDYVQEHEGRPVFRGHGVYGYDPRRERYTMQWWDSMATHGGDRVDGVWAGDTLTFETDHGGPPSRYVYELRGPDTYRFAILVARGRDWAPMMEGLYRRLRR